MTRQLLEISACDNMIETPGGEGTSGKGGDGGRHIISSSVQKIPTTFGDVEEHTGRMPEESLQEKNQILAGARREATWRWLSECCVESTREATQVSRRNGSL